MRNLKLSLPNVLTEVSIAVQEGKVSSDVIPDPEYRVYIEIAAQYVRKALDRAEKAGART